jgi:monothiol glutaredoxin
MTEELHDQIRAQVASSPIHVFMKGTPEMPQCGFSKAVCDVFGALGVEFTATNTLENLDAYRPALMAVTQWPTIPQIFVNGEFIGGCDILIEMYNSGELQQTLGLQTPTAAE